MSVKIQTFTDLNAWKEAHNLVKLIYRFTNTFPQKETFALTGQMRRAVISISSNIAEGFSRRGRKEKIQFYSIAQGSLTELQNQTIIALDIGYLKKKNFKLLQEQTVAVHKLINGLIKGTKKIHNT